MECYSETVRPSCCPTASHKTALLPTDAPWGLPDASVGKEPACQRRGHRRLGFDSRVGKVPWRRAWQLTPVYLAWRIPWTEEPGGRQSKRSPPEPLNALVAAERHSAKPVVRPQLLARNLVKKVVLSLFWNSAMNSRIFSLQCKYIIIHYCFFKNVKAVSIWLVGASTSSCVP